MQERPLFLMEAAAYYETAIQERWNTIPLDMDFKLKSGGVACRVLSRGYWNHDAGPDFLNAKIEIDGKILHGDVEIHCRTSDWARHGHSGDPAYRNVILHAVAEDDCAGAAASEIPFVPVLILPSSFTGTRYREIPPETGAGKCASFFAQLSDEAVHRFVGDAGLERMRGKAQALLQTMLESGTKRAFLNHLFDLVGIPGNRKQFRELAERILSYPEDVRRDHVLALLWGESGCLPDLSKITLPPDADCAVRSIWDEWWTIRRLYETPIAFSLKCRPLNSIGRRIALLASWIRTFGENPLPELIRIVSANPVDELLKIFLEKLSLSDEFWMRHTSFTSAPLAKPAVLIGRDRIIELLTDALIPAMHAYCTVTKDLKQIAQIESFYLSLPKTGSNQTIRNAIKLCFPGREAIFKTAASQQGLLHIYKTWCEKNSFDCKACPVSELV